MITVVEETVRAPLDGEITRVSPPVTVEANSTAPPLMIVKPLATAPAERTSMPPELTVAPIVSPPEPTNSWPPLSTTAPTASPPELTNCCAFAEKCSPANALWLTPLRVVPLATAPELTSTSAPVTIKAYAVPPGLT